jgi:hypothetical protein
MRIRIDTAGVARAIDITDVLERNNPGLTMAHRAFVPVTEYQTRAVEVIKGFAYGVVGAPLRIGFLTERAIGPQGREVILTDVGHPPSLTRGATYLVLLTYSEETNMLMSIAGDVYRVDGRVVRGNSPAAATEYGKAIVGKPVEEALTLVRAAVERAR